MPIKKPGKGHSNPGKYRTIALTFNMCKLMQRMVNEWSVQFLVKKYNSALSEQFSQQWILLCLEDDIKKAQNNKEIVVAMFVDVEKAYDMPWRKGLLIKLHQLGIGENMFSWLRDFFM